MGANHLVILKKAYLAAIVSGCKRIESRFTVTRRGYIGRVGPGDRLFLKESGGPVCAVATVETVKSFEKLTPEGIDQIVRRYNHDIGGSKEYWAGKANCRFGMLVWLKDVERIEPVRISKKDWRAWVVLTEKQDFGLLKAKRRHFFAPNAHFFVRMQ
ncbi:MAG: ASCH domain-containing protein [Planctomycetota bacterium]|jgi:ASC-1-like (ASCH) protein